MKRLGLLGGMSWESTQSYYRLLNQGVRERLGGLHSADLLMHSVDFAPIAELQTQQRWEELGELLALSASRLESAGAEGILICTNTMHRVADKVVEQLNVPLLHIADATAERLLEDGIERVGLLGTAFTMDQEFYKGRLQQVYGLEVIVPESDDRSLVHRTIYEELCLGVIDDGSREGFVSVVERLQSKGAQAVILGCTEIALLLSADNVQLPLYDTTEIHCQKAVEFALEP